MEGGKNSNAILQVNYAKACKICRILLSDLQSTVTAIASIGTQILMSGKMQRKWVSQFFFVRLYSYRNDECEVNYGLRAGLRWCSSQLTAISTNFSVQANSTSSVIQRDLQPVSRDYLLLQ